MNVDVVTVSLVALGTAFATGLGALPFLFVGTLSRWWLAIANAAAAGFMLAASLALVLEGADYGFLRVALGALLGFAFIALTRQRLHDHPQLRFGALRGADALTAFTIVAVMTVHSFSEGLGVGVSFGGGEALGAFITAAIAVHNVPEGLAISLVLVPRGASVPVAAGWSVFSSVPQPLIAAPAFLFVETFAEVLPVGLGFAAGAMAWMVFAELVPAARRDASAASFGIALAVSFAAMMALQALLLEL